SNFGENQLSPCSIGFSPLPTPHPRIFQHTWVRASSQCYLTFTLDMGRSHGFGSTTTYYTPYSDSLSLRLRIFYLTLHGIVTRRSILQKVCRYPLTGFDYLYAHGFRFSFPPLPGCLSPFPHGTGSLSVTREYLALGDGPPGFRRNFSCSAVLRIHSGENILSSTGLLPSMADLSRSLLLKYSFVTPKECPTTPKSKLFGLGSFRFARRYLGNRICFLFLRV